MEVVVPSEELELDGAESGISKMHREPMDLEREICSVEQSMINVPTDAESDTLLGADGSNLHQVSSVTDPAHDMSDVHCNSTSNSTVTSTSTRLLDGARTH